MNKIKKILTIISILALIGAVGMLIASIFGFETFEGIKLSILLSLGTICLGATLLINAVSIYGRKKVLSILNMSLLAVSIVLGLIIIWASIDAGSLFSKITLIFVLATVLFNIIVSNYIKLGKSRKVLQVLTYILIILLDIVLTLVILGIDLFDLPLFPQLFGVVCLLTFILLVTLSILSKKIIVENNDNFTKPALKDGYIEIKKSVYDEMVAKIKSLENELKEYKK